jgi:hypothetical protein
VKEQILSRVMKHMGWDRDKAMLWYTTPNPHFGGATPEQLFLMHRGHKVLKFIEAAEELNGPAKGEGK